LAEHFQGDAAPGGDLFSFVNSAHAAAPEPDVIETVSNLPPGGSRAPDMRQAGQSFSVDSRRITAPQRWHLSFSEVFMNQSPN
jgi:hypothetical protein